MVADGARDADPARYRQPLEPCGDVDAVAVKVVAISDHVAEIDADAEAQAAFFSEIQIAVRHHALDFGGATDRVDDAGEFRQHAIAGVLDGTTVVFLDLGIDQLAQMRPEALVSPVLIRPHQS
jgi:hypothetical protein